MYSADNSLRNTCECENFNFNSSFRKMNRVFFAEGNKSKEDANGNTGPKKVKPVEVRREEVLQMRTRFPNKIPVVVKRFSKETHLPTLDKSKFLVPQEITMSQFQTIIRHRVRLSNTEALFLLVNNRSIVSNSVTLAEVYADYMNPDGYLHITYASQEVFGADYSLYDSCSDYKSKKNCKQNTTV